MIDSSLLDAIYDVIVREDGIEPLLIAVASAFGCKSAALAFSDPARPGADIFASYGAFDTEARRRYQAEYALLDPAPAAIGRLPIGRALATDRVFDERERATSRFLTEFYHPLGLREAIGAPIARGQGCFGVVAAHRGPDRPPFTDREIEVFAEIGNHLARAFELRGRFFAVEKAARVAEAALQDAPSAVLAFDVDGVLQVANRAARAILARGDGLAVTRSGHLVVSDRRADDALRRHLRRTDAAGDEPVIAASRASSERPYLLRTRTLYDDASPEVRCGWLLRVSDDWAPRADAIDTLMSAMNLTRASARLVVGLMAGGSLKSCADQLSISVNTAKFHLKSAFAATGARRQTDLVRQATATLRDLGG